LAGQEEKMERYIINLDNEDYSKENENLIQMLESAAIFKLSNVTGSIFACRMICELEKEVAEKAQQMLKRVIYPFVSFRKEGLREETMIRDIERFLNQNSWQDEEYHL
jgi:hypothetical protein